MTAAPPIDIVPRPPEDALPWEKLSVALVDILGGMQQIVTVDELQRADAALDDSYRGLPPLRSASVVEYWNTQCARRRSCISYLRGCSDG